MLKHHAALPSLGVPPTTVETSAPELSRRSELDDVLATLRVHSVYQPIVELDTGATVAYEALARGPVQHALERPDLLFAAARHEGRLAELDHVCQNAALNGARERGLQSPWTLFVNIEPETASQAFSSPKGSPRNPARAPGSTEAFQVVVELTERALIADPTQLLLLVARIRGRGWGIALDDVGADRDSLALLPLLRPDVIKLDLRLVQQRPDGEIAQIVSAVNAEAERSGSVVLAEGIETEEHLNIALSMGATLGQGWLLGRPKPLPSHLPHFSGVPITVIARGRPTEHSPFALGVLERTPRLARKRLLIEMSKHLERQAIGAGESAVVISTFQDASFFTAATQRRYARLVARTAFVGALGKGMPPEPISGVRGCLLSADDPLVGEWDIVVVGPHFTATLVARDLGDDGPDSDRRFEFVLSYDRGLAIKVALSLMSRVWAKSMTPTLPAAVVLSVAAEDDSAVMLPSVPRDSRITSGLPR